MISTCAQTHPTQPLQDLFFIEKHKLKSTFLFVHLATFCSSFIHLLSPSLGSLGPSWRPCCSPKASFGVPLAPLGASWLPLEHILALWGPPWPSQNLLWLPPRSPVGPLGSIGCPRLHFGRPMGNFDIIFGPSWCILVSVGPILVSTCF